MADGPLSGIRVLDLTSVVMGPYATQMLGDLGAAVILVEPLTPASNRAIGQAVADRPALSGIALNLLRNKRSVALNLKDEPARAAVLRIAASCDVVVSNLRPGALKRLGMTYEDFVEVRPDIIMCNATGFPSDSPRADDPAYDDIIQAESGLPDAWARTGRDPALAPTILADKISGMAIVNGVLAALVHRTRTGRGQRVEVPMAEVMKAFMLVELGGEAVRDAALPAGYPRVLAPGRGPQRTRDGWINMLPYIPADFDAIFAAGGMDELIGDERSSSLTSISRNSAFLYERLHTIAAQRTTAEWLAFCDAKRIPVGRVRKLEELVAELPVETHPLVGGYRLIPPPVRFSDSPAGLHLHTRLLGQDTVDILREAGLSEEEVAAMIERGAALHNPPDD